MRPRSPRQTHREPESTHIPVRRGNHVRKGRFLQLYAQVFKTKVSLIVNYTDICGFTIIFMVFNKKKL